MVAYLHVQQLPHIDSYEVLSPPAACVKLLQPVSSRKC